MGTMFELEADDGHRFGAYVATPAGQPRGGLVVLQEIFGVNAHIRSVADGYAADGYLVIAPALFDRVERGVELAYTPDDQARGRALKTATVGDNPARPLLDVAAALARVLPAGKVGVVGYCWGGFLSWLAACQLDGVSAAITYYGGGIADVAGQQPRCPVLAHFGEKDASIPAEKVQQFRAAQPGVEVLLYDAGHAFNRHQTASYVTAAAEPARERTLAFLRQHVG